MITQLFFNSRKKTKFTLILVVLSLVVLSTACSPSPPAVPFETTESKPDEGSIAEIDSGSGKALLDGQAADLPDLGKAPELSNDVWLNIAGPLRLADLRGKVVLLDMWTFG